MDMAQVLTVSANTAAYVSEANKPPIKVPRSSFVEENVNAFAKEALESGDFQLRAIVNVIQPPALALFFLTAGNDEAPPQVTLQEAKEAYKDAEA
jgi:hypothetical protein